MRSAVRVRPAARALAAAVVAACGAVAAMPNAALAQPPSLAPPTVLDGPSANIVGLSGISVARDGSGGVVYLKDVGGAQHVFVAQLAGSFQPPVRVDAGLPGASSQPVIAADDGGLLLVAFINGGQLYVVDQASTSSGFTTPTVLASGASNPAIAITNLSKAYLAFTVDDGSGHDVRCAYYYQGNWGVEPGSFNVTPADDAGTGTGRPAIAAAGDGVGIVVWGEAGHIYTRRVWGIPPSGPGPSIAYEQADIPSLNGWSEVSVSDPVIGSGGDSSYVAVAFNEVFANGSQQQSRVLMRQLRGGIYDILAQPDGLSTPGVEGADDPQVAAGEYGEGFVTSSRETSHELVEMRLGNNETPGAISQLDSLPNTGAPFAAPTPAGLHSDLIAWQESPLGATPQIRGRFFDGTSFGPEQVLSSPAMGPTDAANGLFSDGDGAADAVSAWVQGAAGSRAIVAAQFYQPPGSFGALKRSRYARSVEPKLSWSASRELWGPLRYVVTLDGTQVGQTTGTSLQLPTPQFPGPLLQGLHTWQVTAVNPAGIARSTNTATVFVDTIAPSVHARLTGRRTPGSPIRIRIRASDAVGIPAAEASGIKSVRVRWGDGTTTRVRHGTKFHVYRKVGRYRITVIVTDRAGNATRIVVKIRIKQPPKPKKRRHGHR
jgi:PKD domain